MSWESRRNAVKSRWRQSRSKVVTMASNSSESAPAENEAGHGTVDSRLPRHYKVWLTGITLSLVGDAVMYFTLGWAASGISPQLTGLVLTMVLVPRVIFLLLGGAIGDRYTARRVVLAADTFMFLATAAAATLVLTTGVHAWLLVTVAICIGTADAFYLPSSSAMPRQLVPHDVVPKAVRIRQICGQAASLVGAPVAGGIIAFVGLGAPIALDSLTFAIVFFAVLATPRVIVTKNKPRNSIWKEIGDM